MSRPVSPSSGSKSGNSGSSHALRAVLTRPADRQHALMQYLQSQGWDVMSLPALNLVPTRCETNSASFSLQWQPAGFDWVMFVSRAAWQFYRRLIGPYWPVSTGIAVVGSGTARIIAQDFRQASLLPDGVLRFNKDSDPVSRAPASISPRMLMPQSGDSQDSEGLWHQLAPHLTSQSRVLIVAGEQGRAWMRDHIRARGAHCEVLTCYRRAAAPIDPGAAATLEQWSGDNPVVNLTDGPGHHFTRNATGYRSTGGVWLFTSRHSIEANQHALDAAGLLARIRPAGLVVTHERLVDPARLWLRCTRAPQDVPVWVSHPDDDSLQATFAQVQEHLLSGYAPDTRRLP